MLNDLLVGAALGCIGAWVARAIIGYFDHREAERWRRQRLDRERARRRAEASPVDEEPFRSY